MPAEEASKFGFEGHQQTYRQQSLRTYLHCIYFHGSGNRPLNTLSLPDPARPLFLLDPQPEHRTSLFVQMYSRAFAF